MEEIERLKKYTNLTPDALEDLDYIENYITNLQEELEEEKRIEKESLDTITNLQEENEKLIAKNLELETLCDKYEEEHKTTFEEWKKDINIIDEFDKWLIGEKMMFYKSNDGERLIRFGETKNKWLELKGDNK